MRGATLRIELFPKSLPSAIGFYTRVLGFQVLRHEPNKDDPTSTTGYAHLGLDTIQLGLSTKRSDEYPDAARKPENRAQFRAWPTGVEIVIEVNDLQAEHDRVKRAGWPLDSALKLFAYCAGT
ncbi:hypothetical protein LTS08_005255 [Lithohypha guttulata]|uniref:VOC domain-containing protein n=1 Tax=Lithohypha guttulata TaxID=1690604 RepID=A0AAN7T843_9EURO|nr:hypothetical protein LTR05_001679 [Lithohypha guttulata]KAK5100504.1 hypothetical protein LTS08_005255 [Lithohypha guttulata]